MIDYSVYSDNSLTAAFGRAQRQNQFITALKADILADTKKLIEQTIDIQIKNEASPALKQFKNDNIL